MKLEAYAVFDSAVGAFNAPMFFRSRGEAVRSFQDACANPEAGFRSHADHYSFHYVGQFNSDNAEFVGLAAGPERVCGARDFVIIPDAGQV
jgi:hypothetical protein